MGVNVSKNKVIALLKAQGEKSKAGATAMIEAGHTAGVLRSISAVMAHMDDMHDMHEKLTEMEPGECLVCVTVSGMIAAIMEAVPELELSDILQDEKHGLPGGHSGGTLH